MNAPADVTIEREAEPADAARALILDGLRAFNRQHVAPPGFEPLTLTARDSAGGIVGGLVGETGWEWLHVDLLWIAEPYRRHGLGKALLRRAEEEAVLRGCASVYLDTFDFQAKPFYERLGYRVFGTQENYPPGHTRYFLRKELN